MTTTPNIGQIQLQINGSDLPADKMARLIDAVVEEDLGQPAMFELRFQDQRFSLVDDQQFKLGDEITIQAGGPNSRPTALLTGEVTAIESDLTQERTTLIIRGYDRSHRMHRERKTRTFTEQSDSDIAGRIARDYGLRTEIEASNPRHKYVMQDNQTDIEFLRTRAARIGYSVTVNERTLSFRKAESSPPQAPDQEWSVNLMSLRTRQSAVAQVGEVQVRGWDPGNKRAIVGRADRSSQPSRVGNGARAGAAAEEAFQSPARLTLVNQPVRDQSEADRLAQAMLDEAEGDYICAEGLCKGDPGLRAGRKVELKGVGRAIAGSYFITATRHVYTHEEGYLTTFYVNGRRPTSLLAAIEERRAPQIVAGVVIGIVTDVNDPDKLGRVKVKFPWLNEDHTSDWCRLSGPGGGPERGLIITPEIDDEVLVAFEHGDIGRPFVIGGLWNGRDKPPVDPVQSNKVVRRALKTRTGHVIELQDDGAGGDGFIVLKTKGGNQLKISDTDRGIVLESPQGTVDVKGAGGKLSISQSGVELSANGTLTIKGAMVQIN